MRASVQPLADYRKTEALAPGLHLVGATIAVAIGVEELFDGDAHKSRQQLVALGAVGDAQLIGCIVDGLLEGDDVLHTADAVRAFGAEVERIAPGEWRVCGAVWRSPAAPVDCGNSGTGARLLMGAAAAFPISATFTGDASLSSRPMERVLAPLRAMGARTEGSTLPVTIHGGGLHGGSSQGSSSGAVQA